MSVILYIVYRTTFCLSMGFIKIRQMFCQPAGNGLPLGDTASFPYDKFTFRLLNEPFIAKNLSRAGFQTESLIFIYISVMEMHQRNANANRKIFSHLSRTYAYPLWFDMLLYTSQEVETVSPGTVLFPAPKHCRFSQSLCQKCGDLQGRGLRLSGNFF